MWAHANTKHVQILIADEGDRNLVLRGWLEIRILIDCYALVTPPFFDNIDYLENLWIQWGIVGHPHKLGFKNFFTRSCHLFHRQKSVAVAIPDDFWPINIKVEGDLSGFRFWETLWAGKYAWSVGQIEVILVDKDTQVRHKVDRCRQIEGETNNFEWLLIRSHLLVLELYVVNYIKLSNDIVPLI